MINSMMNILLGSTLYEEIYVKSYIGFELSKKIKVKNERKLTMYFFWAEE